MFVYISGKIIKIIDTSIILKLPNGVGYYVQINPTSKYQVNENTDFYLISCINSVGQTIFFGFDSFDQWQLANTIQSKGINAKTVADLIWHLGISKLHQSILQKDDSYLKKFEGLGVKNINKILEIEDQEIPASKIITSNLNINDGFYHDTSTAVSSKPESYSPSDFTQRLASLGYSRTRIVGIISVLKKENLWGKMPLVDLVKKSMELLEG